MSKKAQTNCTALNYIRTFILDFAVIGCVSVSSFAFLVVTHIDVVSSAVGLKTYKINAELKIVSQYLRKERRIMIK